MRAEVTASLWYEARHGPYGPLTLLRLPYYPRNDGYNDDGDEDREGSGAPTTTTETTAATKTTMRDALFFAESRDMGYSDVGRVYVLSPSDRFDELGGEGGKMMRRPESKLFQCVLVCMQQDRDGRNSR